MATLKTIFKSIVNAVKNFFKKAPKYVTEALKFAADMGDKLVNFDRNNPLAGDILVSIIPGTADDKALAKFRAKAPEFVTAMDIKELEGVTDPNVIYSTIVKKAKELKGTGTGFMNFMDSFAVQAALIAADGKITADEAKTLMKLYYDNIYKKKQAA